MHAHFHVLPRFRDKLRAGQGIRHQLKKDRAFWEAGSRPPLLSEGR